MIRIQQIKLKFLFIKIQFYLIKKNIPKYILHIIFLDHLIIFDQIEKSINKRLENMKVKKNINS